METQTITLQTICHGGVPEVFERELSEVLKNIADPNTSPEKSRTITLKFVFKPSEDRTGAAIDFSCKAALQPVKMVKSTMYLSRHTGHLKAYVQDARQVALFDGQPDDPKGPMSVVK